MAELVVGPCLRCVDRTRAVVWVEADTPCEVEVKAEAPSGRAVTGRGRTFHVEGHHYGLIVLEPLMERPLT
ncbi:MAG: hypothetical protein ACRD0K_26220 [Egibacteraceae bacterium]